MIREVKRRKAIADYQAPQTQSRGKRLHNLDRGPGDNVRTVEENHSGLQSTADVQRQLQEGNLSSPISDYEMLKGQRGGNCGINADFTSSFHR